MMPTRLAQISDRAEFLRLWGAHLLEQEKDGSNFLATTNNLYRFLDYFEDYINGSLFGMTYFYAVDGKRVGVCMSGEFALPDTWDTTLGKLATLWGVYVDPDHRGKGIGLKLFASVLERGKELGFDAVETYVRVDNEHGRRVAKAFGTKVYNQQCIAPLYGEEIMSSPDALEALGREG
jgi:ribosomal protein S18 acetylase RimI-like enzyme